MAAADSLTAEHTVVVHFRLYLMRQIDRTLTRCAEIDGPRGPATEHGTGCLLWYDAAAPFSGGPATLVGSYVTAGHADASNGGSSPGAEELGTE